MQLIVYMMQISSLFLHSAVVAVQLLALIIFSA
jgi:hypothetical protein